MLKVAASPKVLAAGDFGAADLVGWEARNQQADPLNCSSVVENSTLCPEMLPKRGRNLLFLPISLDSTLFSRGNQPRTQCIQYFRKVAGSKQLHTDAKVPEYYEGRLEGTAPDHLCYILLHSSHSPETFPSVYHTPVSRELTLRAKHWGGLVNFCWEADRADEVDEDNPSATVFSPLGGKLEIPRFSLQNIDYVEELIKRHIKGPQTASTVSAMHIYVCTHGARDCRCGDRGRQVYEALSEAVESERANHPSGPASRLIIGQVGHVGGHKYAANVLLFPQGEWLGIVKPDDVPSIVAKACEAIKRGVEPLSNSTPPLFPFHWRGRMGLSREEQKSLWLRLGRSV